LTWSTLEPKINHTGCKQANYDTTDTVYSPWIADKIVITEIINSFSIFTTETTPLDNMIFYKFEDDHMIFHKFEDDHMIFNKFDHNKVYNWLQVSTELILSLYNFYCTFSFVCKPIHKSFFLNQWANSEQVFYEY
jgi:hypothetical protein